MANQRFATVKNDYCMVFNRQTQITPSSEDKAIKTQLFNFTSIAKLNKVKGEKNTDVLGVLVAVRDCDMISTKSGDRMKRQVTLMDSSCIDKPDMKNPPEEEKGAKINLTIWGD